MQDGSPEAGAILADVYELHLHRTPGPDGLRQLCHSGGVAVAALQAIQMLESPAAGQHSTCEGNTAARLETVAGHQWVHHTISGDAE